MWATNSWTVYGRSYRATDDLEQHFEERLRAAIILRELDGLRYALRYPASGELDDAVEKVRDVVATDVPSVRARRMNSMECALFPQRTG